MQPKIRKAVFPVAGLGTRFLPATKASPKEMLPVVDKPLIQYAVEEAVAAGIEELIFVTSGSKRAIEDHFDKNYELEVKLAQKKKFELLAKATEMLPKGVTCVYVRQQEALGLGHAVWCAKDLVGDEPFAVLLADDLIAAHPKNCLQQMIERYEAGAEGVLAVQEVEPDQVDKYGIVSVDHQQRVHAMLEKPKPDEAPSNLAVVGRYILPPEIFHALDSTVPGAGGEIQLTDAIASLLAAKKIQSHAFSGKRYDCGSRLGFLEATVELALQHPEIGERFSDYLISMVKKEALVQ